MDLQLPNDVVEYIDKYWKPNQDDSFIVLIKDTDIYNQMKDVFDNNSQDKCDIGPFIGISPYGMFPLDDDVNKIEFLFIYDRIDNSKLKAHHLALV